MFEKWINKILGVKNEKTLVDTIIKVQQDTKKSVEKLSLNVTQKNKDEDNFATLFNDELKKTITDLKDYKTYMATKEIYAKDSNQSYQQFLKEMMNYYVSFKNIHDNIDTNKDDICERINQCNEIYEIYGGNITNIATAVRKSKSYKEKYIPLTSKLKEYFDNINNNLIEDLIEKYKICDNIKKDILNNQYLENDKVIDEIQKRYDNAIKEKQEEIKSLEEKYAKIISTEAVNLLIDYDDTIIRLYSDIILQNPIEDEEDCFINRINLLDEILMSAKYKENCTNIRNIIQEPLNEKLEKYQIYWDFSGESFDEKSHRRKNDNEQVYVKEVVSALIIYKDNGNVKQRAWVETGYKQ